MQGVDKNEWLGKRKKVRNKTECWEGKKPVWLNFRRKAGPGKCLEKPTLKGSYFSFNRETERT